jgi:hypothetical protein
VTDSVDEKTARVLCVILIAMTNGLVLLAGVVAFFHFRSAGVVPTPEQLKTANLLTAMAMGGAVAAIVASEAAWRGMILRGQGPMPARATTAFVVRVALREGSALFGLVAGLVAAQRGVLRVYPAYWADLVPFALFLSFAATHWPSADNLNAEIAALSPR